MSGVTLNPNAGTIGANNLQSDNTLNQQTGLDALRAQPSFTFEGSQGLNGIQNEPSQDFGKEGHNNLMYHDPRNPDVWDEIKGIFTKYPRGDSDGDGVPNYMDYMHGGNDKAAHFHRSDGSTVGQNKDGTWSLYDENGTKVDGKFEMTSTTDNTGNTKAGNAGKDGVGFSFSNNGTTYTFTPVS